MAPARSAADVDTPVRPRLRQNGALLPPPVRGWPAVLRVGAGAAAVDRAPSPRLLEGALARLRAERLFWPAPRSGARRPRAAVFDPAALAEARASFSETDIAVAADPAEIDPERLERVWGGGGAITLWAVLGGVAGPEIGDPLALLSSAEGRSPWTGAPLTLEEAVEAQACLRAAALAARGPVTLLGMSAWKRRCLRPFFTGPDGPPRSARTLAAVGEGPVAVWGADAPAPPGALRVEDGFLRSVGLGLRHTPPVSITAAVGSPYFDATRRTAFAELAETVAFEPQLLARARRLRERLVALGLTKYNLPEAAPPPAARGRLRLLVPGQVAGDASLRYGGRAVRDDSALLRAARARFPDAFMLYKPHPDVLTGLREGRACAEAEALADHVEHRASALQCLEWADQVATITSLMGFEALLRKRAVTTFGRPFYAGWGLTDDVDPPERSRALTLDALVAAALILHPRYIDPKSGLPATPEAALDALVAERRRASKTFGRVRRMRRDIVSWLLNQIQL